MEFKHLLITRLNVYYKTKMAERGFDPEVWLLERVEIFKKFCFPSILNQANKAFYWFFYIDSETPAEVRADLEELFRPYPFITLIAHQYENFSIAKFLRSDIDQYLGGDFQFLVSSRVDTDDMLHRDYISNVQSRFNKQVYMALNFNKGLVYDVHSGVSSVMVHRYNAFLSLIEKRTAEGFKTVFHKPHTAYRQDSSRIEIKINQPMWCVTIHGLNDSTSFYGQVIKFKQPDLSEFFGLKFQKHPPLIEITQFSIRSYKRKLIKIKVRVQRMMGV